MTYICAVCGVEKKDSNHWFVHQSTRVGFHLMTWDWAVREGQLDEDGTEYVCGHECSHTLLGQFLSNTGKPREGKETE